VKLPDVLSGPPAVPAPERRTAEPFRLPDERGAATRVHEDELAVVHDLQPARRPAAKKRAEHAGVPLLLAPPARTPVQPAVAAPQGLVAPTIERRAAARADRPAAPESALLPAQADAPPAPAAPKPREFERREAVALDAPRFDFAARAEAPPPRAPPVPLPAPPSPELPPPLLALDAAGARLSLDAGDAGALSVRIDVRDGTADLRVAGAAAPLLAGHAGELRAAFAAEGLRLGSLELGADRGGNGGGGGAPERETPHRQPPPHRPATPSQARNGRLHVKA